MRDLVIAVGLAVVVSLTFFSGCTSRKTTAPDEPEEPARTMMQQYFPLSHGDEWTWGVIRDYYVVEEFVDGDSSLGEPFTDSNQNGVFDTDEAYEDLNANGRYDGPNVPWTPPLPFADRNGDGDYDAPNGFWENGELFLDMDGNQVYSWACTLTLCASVLPADTVNGLRVVEGQFLGSYSDGEPGQMWGECDLYTNDSLGLRWHGHIDLEDTRDFLAELCDPLVMAAAEPRVGDEIASIGCRFSKAFLLSIFEGTEDVSVPAGDFEDCFKFKFFAADWGWSMKNYNGASYRWYAKDVGLVKSIGPGAGKSRVLKYATVGGISYPEVR